MNSETRICQNCKQQFTIESDDFSFYEKIQVPPPTFCFDCRAIRRMIFWNEHFLYRKKEALEGKSIFSTYPEEADVKIYDHDYWWSDKWDPMQYGRDYDSSKPFFEQYHALIKEIPWPSRSIRGLVNSDYCNQASYLKECYLCFNCENAEECLYAVGFKGARNSMDFYWSSDIELSYEVAFSGELYQCFWCVECDRSRNLWFSRNCDDCNDCFGCANLKHKKYHIFNEPYTKEEYLKKIKEFNIGSYRALTEMQERVRVFWLQFPMKYMHGSHNTPGVVGDYIWNSKNVRYVFQGSNMDNVRYSQNLGFDIKDSYDYTNWGDGSELIYDCVSVGDKCRNVKFCFDCWPGCEDLEYCISCHSSSHLFGCFGLKKKQYCILNKQYSKEDYEKLRAKIIAHMSETPYISATRKIEYRYGEFFPFEFSPLAYNETAAIDYYPLDKQGAAARSFLWRDPHQKEYKITIPSDAIPDHINDVQATITKEIIGCKACKRAYRILPRELEFYKRFGLSLPRPCPDCRHVERTKLRNPLAWYKRQCMCAGKTSNQQPITNNQYTNAVPHFHGDTPCPNEFETSYAPERPEIVYCEQCYQAEVA